MRFVNICLLGLVLSQAVPAAGQVIVDTTPTWDGTFTMGSLCPTGAFGQTFTLAEPTAVDSFSFFMKTTPPMPAEYCDPYACQSWDPVTFRGQVLAWDPVLGRAVGPILYESTGVYTTSDTLTEYVFETGALSLPPGTYVAVINAAGLGNFDDARGDMGIAPWYVGDPYNGGYWVDTYPDGEWVFSQCTDAVDPSEYTWSTQGVEMDTAFTLYGTTEPACPDLSDASGNGIPDVVDAICPCDRKREYVACVAQAMNDLVLDECATSQDAQQATRAAKHSRCR